MGACISSKNNYEEFTMQNDRACSNIDECEALNELQNVLNLDKYLNSDSAIDDIDIQDTFDNYTHLLQYHDNDNDFEHIYNVFGGFCDMNECNMFKRNYRNRSEGHNENQYESSTASKIQIVFAIYCANINCRIPYAFAIYKHSFTTVQPRHGQQPFLFCTCSNIQ
eukprot:UN08549